MTRCILVVDDEPDLRLLTRFILESEGHEVEEVRTGEAAIERVRQQDFDLVLLDIRLPDLDGRQVLTRLRGIRPEMKVLMMSAHQSPSTLEEAKDKGASGYIVKPFRSHALIEEVNKLLGV